MKHGVASAITVLLVDDHAVVREGYQRLLARDPRLQVVGGAANSAEALDLDRRLQPDVLVMDIALPGVSGIETARRIVARRSGAKVLMFSMYQDAIYAKRAFDAGALGYVSKSSAPDLLVDAVRSVAQGARFVSPDVQEALSEQPSRANELVKSLSPREHEILRLLTLGYDLEGIAERLGVSAKTVANQQSSIKQKLGANSALQLILIARQIGVG